MPRRVVNPSRLQYYKYQLEVTVLDAGEPVTLPAHGVRGLIVECDYANNFLPIFRIPLNVSASLFYRIQEHRSTVKFRVVMKKFPMGRAEDTIENFYGDRTIFRAVDLDAVFQPFMLDITPYLNRDMHERGDAGERQRDLKSEPEGDFVHLELYMFSLDHLNMNKEIINAVIQDSGVTGALGYALTKAGVQSLLMSRPDNQKTYGQILLPQGNLRNTVEYLQRTYGIYRSGLRQFLDVDMYYILSNDLSEVPVRRGEYETVYINLGKNEDAISQQEGCYRDDENRCYIINLPHNVGFSSDGVLGKETSGNVVRTFSFAKIMEAARYDEGSGKFIFGKGYDEVALDIQGYTAGKDKVVYTYNHMDGNFVRSEFEKERKENDLVLTIPLNDVDREMLTPNKRYIIRFQDVEIDSAYGGVYKLSSCVWGVDRRGEEAMDLYAVCEFKLHEKA